MSELKFSKYLAFFLIVLFCVQPATAQDKSKEEGKKSEETVIETAKKGRLPVIIIPGLIGSELINKKTDERVWFSLGRADGDDLRLPISPNLKANQDDLIAGDILRSIQIIRFTPEIGIYQSLIDSLKKDGYTEGKMDDAPATGFEDTFYVFPYDWRRDNVENAHLLLQKLDKVRARVKHPKLKFNVVAHSMGGLITRYAAMYGTADLSSRKMRPNWRGASYFNNISMVATPNGGSLSAFNSLLNGFSFLGKINIPFVRNLSKYDLFTIPSIYQLLPHEEMIRAFDENLEPIEVDIYSPKTWEKYGWLAYTYKDFGDEFSLAEQNQAEKYFRVVLRRAKLFQAALNAKSTKKTPVKMYFFGSECKPTMDGMIIYKDAKNDKWKTLFEPKTFTKSDGTKVSEKQLREILYSPGDGVVAKRSLISSLMEIRRINKQQEKIEDLTIVCGEHNRLTTEEKIDKSILSVLNLPLAEFMAN